MSWRIALVKNEPVISKNCALDLFMAQLHLPEETGDVWNDEDEVTYNGKLAFNSDHREHMDFLHDDDCGLADILCKHKVKGDICFADTEAHTEGRFWGYRFDGNGGMKRLRGRLVWEERE